MIFLRRHRGSYYRLSTLVHRDDTANRASGSGGRCYRHKDASIDPATEPNACPNQLAGSFTICSLATASVEML